MESPARNARGTVVAYGSLGGIDRGIYMGGPGANAPVIQVGDTLAGSSVAALSFYRALNEADQIAFWFRLEDGRSGIARMDLASLPSPPHIDLSRAGSRWAVTWSNAPAGGVLESTTNLSAGPWQTIRTVRGGVGSVTIEPRSNAMFFRIR